MQALLLVGGKGTRLRPLTERLPKPLVPVALTPIIWRSIEALRREGVDRITLGTSVDAASAYEGLIGEGRRRGVEIELSVEDRPLGSGGAIAKATADWPGPFFVVNGDVVTDADLSTFAGYHRSVGADLSLLLWRAPDPWRFGVVVQAASGRIVEFVEKPERGEAPSDWVNAGVWLFERPLLGREEGEVFSRVEEGLFPAMAKGAGRIFGYRHEGYWLDVGTIDAYRQANADALKGIGPWPRGENDVSRGGVELGAAVVDGVARVGSGTRFGPGVSLLGSNVIGAGCAIGRGSVLEDCVVWDGVQVGAGVEARQCIFADGVVVADDARLVDVVLGPDVVVREGESIPSGARIDGGVPAGRAG